MVLLSPSIAPQSLVRPPTTMAILYAQSPVRPWSLYIILILQLYRYVVASFGGAYANTRRTTRQRRIWRRTRNRWPPWWVLCRLRLSGNALFRRDRTVVGMMGFSAVGPSRVLLRAEQRAHGRRRIAPTRCHGRPAHAADDTLALTRWPTVDPLMLHPHTRDPSEV